MIDKVKKRFRLTPQEEWLCFLTVGNYREGYETLAKSKNESIQLAYERLYTGHLTPKEKK